MAISKQQKEEVVKDLVTKAKEAKSMVFMNFAGLKVKEIEELRKKFREENVEYLVAKKTLMDIAFKDAKISGFDSKKLESSVAVAFGMTDEVAPAKIASEFSKEHESLQSIGGVLEGKYVEKDQVLALAKLPSRDELYAKIVGSINAPVSGFVNVLAGNLRNLVYVLSAIKDSK